MVDRENLPRPAPELIEDGVPATEELPPSQLLTGDPLEGELPPLDRPQAAMGWGTTASEQLAPEPLDVRVAREEPEVGLDDIDDDIGAYPERQIIEPGAEGGIADAEGDVVGEIDAGFEDSLSAEEAAMRVVDEPLGMNYDPDPGYVDDQELP
jgi:hypothetical protein